VREKTGHALAGARQWIPAEQIEDPLAGRAVRASGSAGSCSVAAREGPGSGSPGGRGSQGGEELAAPGRVIQDIPGQLLDPGGELGVEVG
jgi:hypothetical protein